MIPLNIPNILTLFRIALLPIFVLAFYWPHANPYWSAGLFALAAATDWLDGYLARSLQQFSAFGAFLDPVADKLIVAAALLLIVEKFHCAWITVPAIIIVGREIAISALREWMAELGKRASVNVSLIGKTKSALQMTSIIFLLAIVSSHSSDLSLSAHSWIFFIGVIFLYIAASLTLWSMFLYLRAAFKAMKV